MADEPQSEPVPPLEAEVVEPDEAQAEEQPLPPTATETPGVAAAPVVPPDTGYTASGVPTFESVREKIENRFGASLGAAELDAETPEGRSIEEQYDARNRAAAERLAQIRESMGGETPKPDKPQ